MQNIEKSNLSHQEILSLLTNILVPGCVKQFPCLKKERLIVSPSAESCSLKYWLAYQDVSTGTIMWHNCYGDNQPLSDWVGGLLQGGISCLISKPHEKTHD